MAFSVGKKTLKLNDENAMLFAHGQANKAIADFRPTNRPQMFQGAAGMPFGLFTTWAINWLQRVFGDLEAGRLGATFWQTSMQGFFFGANSLPGVETFMETFMTSYDGKTNVQDVMDGAYGRSFTDAFFQGTIASMTGVALQSRANISIPAVFSGEPLSQAAPSLNVWTTLLTGVSEGMKSIRQNGGFNPREMSEIMSLYSVNGFARNLFQELNNTAVDRHGAVINNNIRSFESSLPRFFEFKSTRETRKAKELQRDRMQREIERGHMNRLRTQLRAAIRGGNVNKELIESALQDAWNAGLPPEDFASFFREQVIVGTTEKSTRLLLRALKQSDEQGKAMRLWRMTMDDEI